jgi:hypothetical protein
LSIAALGAAAAKRGILHSALGYRPPVEFEDLWPFLSTDDPPQAVTA